MIKIWNTDSHKSNEPVPECIPIGSTIISREYNNIWYRTTIRDINLPRMNWVYGPAITATLSFIAETIGQEDFEGCDNTDGPIFMLHNKNHSWMINFQCKDSNGLAINETWRKRGTAREVIFNEEFPDPNFFTKLHKLLTKAWKN